MPLIAILSDAHLLMQAEWVEDKNQITNEGNEVLENFDQAIKELKNEKPDAVLLAGDMFDYRTKTHKRVAHREGEKYMVRIRTILEQLADDLNCKIYALKGNHDSEPVLKSTEKALKGNFVYCGDKKVDIHGLDVFFLNSHYVPGLYEIPLEKVPKKGDLLIMHESAPLWGIPAPSKENFRVLCARFKLVFNGHMHLFQRKALGISNLYMIPAFIPSREIKNSWMLRYKYPGNLKPEERETPFGYIMLKDETVQFKLYNPFQIIVRVEIKGEKSEDFLNGIKEVYDILTRRKDRDRLRIWIETNSDPVTINRLLWPVVREYPELCTMDIMHVRTEMKVGEVRPSVEFEGKAFTRQELLERVLKSLKSKQKEVARRIFQEIFTVEYLRSSRPDEPTGFKKLLEIISRDYKVSDGFLTRAWELAKRR